MKRRAFTLIELLVVIGIILLLMTLTMVVGTGVMAQSDRRTTENLMRTLSVAVEEFATARDGLPTFGVDDEPACPNVAAGREPRYAIPQLRSGPYTWASESAARTDARVASAMFWRAAESTVTQILASISPQMIHRPDDIEWQGEAVEAFEFLDPWNNPIILVHPGRVYSRRCGDESYCIGDMAGPDGHCPDDDGTIRTPFERRFGVATDRSIMLVSAGASGVFGDRDDDNDSDDSDNIYSKPPG